MRSQSDMKDLDSNSPEPAPKILKLENSFDPDEKRVRTGVEEVDRVLGGGLVSGSLLLLSGEPGVGKSTLVAQISDNLARIQGEKKVLYVSGEESASQVGSRFSRLGCDLSNINFLGEIRVERIIAGIKELEPELVIIDSIQTVYTKEVSSGAGGVTQISASTVKFLELAKERGVSVVLVGHITKDGQVAGPKSLEHIVDSVLYLESSTSGGYSILRSSKNRFGSVDEVGVFEMSGTGFKEIVNPSLAFIDNDQTNISGAVITCVLEGSRSFLLDVQALVTKTVFGYPQRKASGIDINRLQILTAVISKRTKIDLTSQDVVINVVGGFKINDTSLDLAICTAIITSLLNQTMDRQTMVLGEVGLGGEVRSVPKLENRLKEGKKMGFKRAIIPNVSVESRGLELKKISQVSDILSLF